MEAILSNSDTEIIKYDLTVDISNYKHVRSKNTEVSTIKYSDFLNKFVEPAIIENPDNVPLFIGGYVDGEREKKNIVNRSILMIDIDTEQQVDVIQTLKDKFPYAWFIHTSYSSTPEFEKYHLGIPLKESISPNQYKYLTKYVNLFLGFDIDSKADNVSQMMKYAACKKENSQYYFMTYNDAPFLDPKEVEETNEYNRIVIEQSLSKKASDKEGNPKDKQNWIGAWCNVYSVSYVLDNFLTNVYRKTNSKGRYTLNGVNSEGGLIVLDNDTKVYSHHETDKLGDHAYNSFDLYRIHKYEHLDVGISEDTAMHNKPSYKKMIELCKTDKGVSEYYYNHIYDEINLKDSVLIDLKEELQNRKIIELKNMEERWIEEGKNGRKPTIINPIRVASILEEYVSFILFDLEENTRIAMYQPKEGIYTRNTTLIKRVISWLEPSLNNSKADDVIYYLTNNAEVRTQTESRYLIPVQNGVFNLKTKQLEPFTPDYVFTTKIETSYKENPINPIINGWDVETWLQSIASNDSEIVHLLWQVINDALNGNYSRKKAIFLVGDGNNGKGTFQELITNLIGMKNIATLKVNQFEERFQLASLEGKTAVIGDDVPANVYIDDSSNFNSVVTGDVVQVEIKNKQPYNARYRCCVIQSTNGMPKFRNKSGGTTRRVLIVPFNADFNGQVENFDIKNEYIKNKKVLEYVLYKAINMDFEQFDIPAASLEELEIFKQDNDPVLDFKYSIFDMWDVDFVPKPVVYGAYKLFCKENSYKPLADRSFHKSFKSYLGVIWKDNTIRMNEKRDNHLLERIGHMQMEQIRDEYGLSRDFSKGNYACYEKV